MIKVFEIEAYEAANEFIDTVVLSQQGVVLNGDTIVVFYESLKDDYEPHFKSLSLDSLERNLIHENIRLLSAQVEVDNASDDTREEMEKSLEQIKSNINRINLKIKALHG